MLVKIDFKEAAEHLHSFIDDSDADTLAALYEYAFGAVQSCEQSPDEDCLVVMYHEKLGPNGDDKNECH